MLAKITTVVLSGFAASVAFCQSQPAAPRTGPSVTATQDPRYPEVIKTCKSPPPARGGGKGKAPQGRGPGATPAGDRDYAVTAIPGVIAAGQRWREIWHTDGNNADGIIASTDGGLLIPQNETSLVVKVDKNGKESIAYTGTNTGGALAMNSKGALFVANRGLYSSIEQLAPQRRKLADKYNGDPLECIGGGLNDLTADSKGGVYFTMGGVFYADPKGVVTRYGENINPNGIVLSPDEKHLYVTNGMTLAAFDVQKDGSLTNQREFAKLEAGGADGSTFDTAGRLYVSAQANPVQVVGPDGKFLGIIPAPRSVSTIAISGPNRKTLYGMSRDNVKNTVSILAIDLIAQGPKGRAK